MLKKIAKRINKELEQARDYIHQAFIVKEKSPQTADLFCTLAEEEIEHAEKLLREGQRLTSTNNVYSYEKVQRTETENAWHEKCKIIWEWETRIVIDEVTECKKMISMYKGG